MTIISTLLAGSGDAYARLVEGLRIELGTFDVDALASRILEDEKADFHWQARVRERYLGQQLPLDPGDEDASGELERIAILSFLGGRWHAGICLVDGDGCAAGLLWIRTFERHEEALETFGRAR